MPHRIAFYPCCATDVEEPLKLLTDFADEVIFCDVNTSLARRWNEVSSRITQEFPRRTFISEDVRIAVHQIERIDVLFYRRDTAGEGGSGIFILGDSFLPRVLQRMPPEGGYIIADGSNCRGGNFRRMIRNSGLTKHGRHFRHATEQPFLAEHGLHVILVLPEVSQ